MQLTPNRQADVMTKVIRPAQTREGFTFVYPILFDDWDAKRQVTSTADPHSGGSQYEVIRK